MCPHNSVKAQSTTQLKQIKQTNEPKLPKIKWNKESIKLNGKVHGLPITKEYILKEYADVFQGIGTLPGGPYHIRLKEDYRPVQHPPRSVPIAMQPAYKTELERLVKEGIITEVHKHTEWINSIVPVMKPDGSLRLCLDLKDLNKAIERNQWYSRTLDNILPETSQLQIQNPQRCNIRILACTTRPSKQSAHNIQHTLGQIQMAQTAIWT